MVLVVVLGVEVVVDDDALDVVLVDDVEVEVDVVDGSWVSMMLITELGSTMST